jgi:iron complex transport system permease protein
LAVGVVAVSVIAVLAAGVGAVQIPLGTTVSIALDRLPGISIDGDWPASWETILWKLRFPRIVMAGIVGGVLALSGAAYQGLFRNPLADPYLVGVASGAGLGAALVFLTGLSVFAVGGGLLPIAAFSGAIVAVTVSYMVARRSDGLPLTTLILAGVAVAALAGAVTSLLMIRSDPSLRPLLAWLLGGFSGSRWTHAWLILPYVLPGVLILLAYARVLNVMQLGDDHARAAGVNVERTKIVLLAVASLLTAAAVAFSGIIGFVGLVAPHVVRRLWGADHRFLMPMSVLVGAGFLILADLGARTLASPAELPVGIITAFAGAPFFLFLLTRPAR